MSLLTDEEIKHIACHTGIGFTNVGDCKEIAKAQDAKSKRELVEWLDKVMRHHVRSLKPLIVDRELSAEDWQALCREALGEEASDELQEMSSM